MGRIGARACKLPDLEGVFTDLSKLNETSTPTDFQFVNARLESAFDFVVSHNMDNLDAVRSYFSKKDCLNEISLKYARLLDSLSDQDEEQIANTVTSLFSTIQDKLLSVSKPVLIVPCPANGSQMPQPESRIGNLSESPNQIEFSQKASAMERPKLKEMGSLKEGNLSDFEVVSNSRGCASLYNSPVLSSREEGAYSSSKKPAKSRFNDLAQDAKVKAFHRDWPLLQKSNTLGSGIAKKEAIEDSSPCSNDLTASPPNMSPYNRKKKSSDNYQDNSPSMISLITRDEKKVIKDRVATFELLMRSAWYLKSYLKHLTLKKQEILILIESFFFDDKALLDTLAEHRIEHNNPRTLHRVHDFLESHSKALFKSPRKVHYTFRQTLEFLVYFEIVAKDHSPILRSLYDKLDHRVYGLWDEFGKLRHLIEFGGHLNDLAIAAQEEKKAASKLVAHFD